MKGDAPRRKWGLQRGRSGMIAASMVMAGFVGLTTSPASARAIEDRVQDDVVELERDGVELLDVIEVEFDDGVEIELFDRIEVELG